MAEQPDALLAYSESRLGVGASVRAQVGHDAVEPAHGQQQGTAGGIAVLIADVVGRWEEGAQQALQPMVAAAAVGHCPEGLNTEWPRIKLAYIVC